jgi:hypothetical protein
VALSCMEQSAAGTLAWPWCGAYLGAALLPWGVLVGFGLIGGLRLSRAFLLFALPGAIGMVVAWAVSPYRTQTGVWLLWPLAGVAWAIVVGQITAGTRHRGMPFALPLLSVLRVCCSVGFPCSIGWSTSWRAWTPGGRTASRSPTTLVAGWPGGSRRGIISRWAMSTTRGSAAALSSLVVLAGPDAVASRRGYRGC